MFAGSPAEWSGTEKRSGGLFADVVASKNVGRRLCCVCSATIKGMMGEHSSRKFCLQIGKLGKSTAPSDRKLD